MSRAIPVYLRDEATHEFLAPSPFHPGQLLRAATLPDLRRKLRAAQVDPQDDAPARSGLATAPAWTWDQSHDDGCDTVYYVKM